MAVRECGDGVWAAPRMREIPAGAKAEIVIYKTQRPRVLRIKAWAVAEPFGRPVGPTERIPLSLRRFGRYWRAVFSLPIPCRHYYMHLEGLWEDTDVPDFDANQDGVWIFHAATRLPITVGPKLRAPTCVVPLS